MARKFLYLVAGLIVLFLAALFALRIAGDSLAEIAFVPSGDFVEQEPLADNAYADPAMWLSHPRRDRARDPARWAPPDLPPLPALGPTQRLPRRTIRGPTPHLHRRAETTHRPELRQRPDLPDAIPAPHRNPNHRTRPR